MKIKFTSVLLILLLFISCKQEKASSVDADIIAVETGLLPPVVVKGESAKTYTISERMEFYNVPGISIALVEDGELKWAKGYGIANTETGSKVDAKTMFQAGSISKPLAALAALKLVDQGVLELDKDVNEYFKNWKVTENGYADSEKVTLRRLLTHTAGLTVHGFPGYKQSDEFPEVETVLNGEGNTAKIELDTIPGSIWRYSGGGYTVMELLVEEISGKPLETYAAEEVLGPMGMERSTYQQPLGEALHDNASAAYQGSGELYEGLWHNYPEQAAAGLWTTPADLALYCLSIQKALKGAEHPVLSGEMIEEMLTKHKNDWGLGPALRNEADSLMFGHGGKNAGFTNNMMAFAHQGRALIVMTNADRGNSLIEEITRAVSAHYDWSIAEPREVTLATLTEEELNDLTGDYLLDFQVPDIGDYWIDVSVKGNQLIVNDPNNDEVDTLSPLEKDLFIDLDDADEVKFTVAGDSLELLFNNRFRFVRKSRN